MIGRLLDSLRRGSRDRALKAARKRAAAVTDAGLTFPSLGDAALAALTDKFRQALGEGEPPASVVTEALAAVREAVSRGLGMKPYPVQIMGAMALNGLKVAEMATGEGKTLSVLMAAYVEALPGKGVHVVTTNDYLARRDAASAGAVLPLLGMTVGCVCPGMGDDERRAAYAADVTYIAGSEAGFDYLRDNMRLSPELTVQRPFACAIVDEVDSILIDESRTPLIISGEGPDRTAMVMTAHSAVACLGPQDFEADIRSRSVHLTDRGLLRVEAFLRTADVMSAEGHLHDDDHKDYVSYVHQALRALVVYRRDLDYIVYEGKIVIIDPGTGRMMPDRRYSDGLHQALEAKEGVAVLPDNVTLASVTYQALFRLYPRLSGMTGTTAGVEEELGEVYGLEVVRIPTNAPVIRADSPDEVFVSAAARDGAVVRAVLGARASGRPVLIGTASVEKSDNLSALLTAAGVPHAVLNALNHEREARIISQAGRPGAVTVATDMAGRGTDICLGGSVRALVDDALPAQADAETRAKAEEQLAPQVEAAARRVKAAGGLLVIGTERHESKRVDDQLRGRSGRQGDPGGSVFMVSLQDDVVRRFGSLSGGALPAWVAQRAPADAPIPHAWAARAVIKAQLRAESHGQEVRRSVFRFDRITSLQRAAFYGRRREILHSADTTAVTADMRDAAVREIISRSMPGHAFPEQWDLDGAARAIERLFSSVLPIRSWASQDGADAAYLTHQVIRALEFREREAEEGMPPGMWKERSRQALLVSLDRGWQHHLSELESIREGIGLRAVGQRDPLHEWNAETSVSFELMSDHAAEQALILLWRSTAAPVVSLAA